jgi:RimJ/RimL family protein N-acetyltransferase
MTQSLTTERLILRPLEHADAERIALLANNWKVASMVGRMPHPYSEEDAHRFLAQINSPNARGHVFAITRDDVFIGIIGLEPYPDDFEFGYWVGEPYWGQGYATEAGQAVLAFGFRSMGFSHIVAGHFVDNPASGRVLQKLGFRYSGMEKRRCLARGHDIDILMMALSRADWDKR